MSLTLKCVGAVSGSVTVQADATVADLFRELERLAAGPYTRSFTIVPFLLQIVEQGHAFIPFTTFPVFLRHL